MPDGRRHLLDSYYELHARRVARPVYEDLRRAWPHYEANYAVLFEGLDTSARILEVGPGHGSFIAWLVDRGFPNVEGIDVSSRDVELANSRLDRPRVAIGDGRSFLQDRPSEYDVVVMKAVLEHVPEEDLLDTVAAVAGSLRAGGFAIFEVPNMDWILAGHERYMDLTHTIGFTRESLGALLRTRFAKVEIQGSVIGSPTRSQRVIRRPLVWTLRMGLYILGEGASDLLFEHRSLIGRAARVE